MTISTTLNNTVYSVDAISSNAICDTVNFTRFYVSYFVKLLDRY